jgi:hypothetical protein
MWRRLLIGVNVSAYVSRFREDRAMMSWNWKSRAIASSLGLLAVVATESAPGHAQTNQQQSQNPKQTKQHQHKQTHAKKQHTTNKGQGTGSNTQAPKQ